ncbi:amidohydrolase family protein [Marinicella sp. W31]|uniref:amidohydrolase n=1 Tax=Marinicella sp. W31 TaxID=3023713 RepID=UPI003756CA3B
MKIKYLFLLLLSFSCVAEVIVLDNITAYSAENGQIKKTNTLIFDTNTGLILEDSAKNRQQGKRVDAQGAIVLPGLIDAHGHVLEYGLGRIEAQLRDINTLEQTLNTIKRYADENPNNSWIIGRGWNQVLWTDTNGFPNRQHLDTLVTDKPVWLSRVDGHAGWANSKALELAGIDKAMAADNDLIIKDQNGEPTGILIDNAMRRINEVLPQPSQLDKIKAFKVAFTELAAAGLTSVHDAGIGLDSHALYQQLAQQDAIPIRIYAMLDGSYSQLKDLLAPGHTNIKDRYIVRSVKMMIDGALGSYGALMHQPYSDKTDTTGAYVMSREHLENNLKQVVEHGFQANIHAIGDRGNSEVIDLLSQKWADSKTLRHRVEHAQIMRLEDILRLQRNHIIASMQPTHATSDMNMAENRIGAARIKGGYAWKTIEDSGVVIASGSDFPVELFNPFFGLHAAVTRQNRQDQPTGGWYANEAMDIEQAFKTFTIHAAYAAHMEDKIGNLEVGKYADFIIINQDIFTIDKSKIWSTQVLETWVSGRKIH